MKKAFDTVYNRLLELKLDENILCKEFWRKIVNLQVDFNEEKAWQLLTDNFVWLINSGVATTKDIKEWFTESDLKKHNIYLQGLISITDKRVIGLGTAKIVAMGHSRVILFDVAGCEAYDSTFVSGYHNSQFTVKECMGESFNNCKCVALYQSKVEAWDNSKVEAKDYSFVIKHDNTTGEVSNKAHSIVQ